MKHTERTLEEIKNDKSIQSIVETMKRLRIEKGPQKWNSPKQLAWLKVVDTFVESDFDVDQTRPVLLEYIAKFEPKIDEITPNQ
jgi:hypothetical protein